MTKSAAVLSRRKFIEGAAALAATTALPQRALTQPTTAARLGDAHVHLFNLADLPARGFFEHAVMWNTQLDYWVVRPMWPAMLDLIAFFKSKSVSARKELEDYRYDSKAPESIGKEQFSTWANTRISNMARQGRAYGGAYRIPVPEPLSLPQQHLRNSYYQLAAWLAIAGEPMWRRKAGEAPHVACLNDADVVRIRAGARRLHERSCPEEPGASGNMGPIETIRQTLEWGRMLMQSRQHQLSAYRQRITDGELRPATIVNLLVDYDEWLDDAPASDSGADAQIAYWRRIRRDYHLEIDVRTFAGFDPLRQGLERRGFRRPGAPSDGTTFDRDCGFFRERAIHGFKLYSPMGFRPAGNDASMFRGDRRGLGVLRRRLQACEIEWDELPTLLNEALDEFYRFCAGNGVPILAHAFHSNEAFLCAGARAGPSGWLDVLNRHHGLRICLGHFAEGADFVRAARRRAAGRTVHRRNWSFHGTEELLRRNRSGSSEVFVDLSYMAEFLHDVRGRDRAIAFFQALRQYCLEHDPNCEHFMFGTDWIMLEREARSEKYVSRVREGMGVADWPDHWRQNLLHDNLQRFLETTQSA